MKFPDRALQRGSLHPAFYPPKSEPPLDWELARLDRLGEAPRFESHEAARMCEGFKDLAEEDEEVDFYRTCMENLTL